MAPQALDLDTKGLGLQSADSAEAGSTKYQRLWKTPGERLRKRGYGRAGEHSAPSCSGCQSSSKNHQCHRTTARDAGEGSSPGPGLQGQAPLWGTVIPEESQLSC